MTHEWNEAIEVVAVAVGLGDLGVEGADVEVHQVGDGVERSRLLARELLGELLDPVDRQLSPRAQALVGLREVAGAQLDLGRRRVKPTRLPTTRCF